MGSPVVTITPDSSPVSITPDSTPESNGGLQLSNPSTVPNARIRNLPNPAAGETSALGALYHGAKTGAQLASIPASLGMRLPVLLGSVAGGTIGNFAASTLAKAEGAGPMGQEIAGDAGGILGGIYGAGKGGAAGRFIDNVMAQINPKPIYPGAPNPAHPGIFPGAPYPQNPGTFPGAPFPATPPPEVLNPSLVSESRTLPGQIGREVVRPPSQPIPPRSGLMLPGQVTPQEAMAQIKAAAAQPQALPETQNIPLKSIGPMGHQGVQPDTPAMQTANSTTIAQHAYDPVKQQMFVQFKNGNVYRYSGVPKEVFNSYQNAESQGSFHANNIKGRYQTDLIAKVPPVKPLTSGQKAKIAMQSRSLGNQ